MCAVAVIPAVIGLATAITTTAVSAKMQSDAATREADFAADQARENAALARVQAADAAQRGGSRAASVIHQGRRVQASALAAIGKSGVTGEGSLGNLLTATAYTSEVSAINIEATAARAAWGFDLGSEEQRRKARRAREAGFLGSISAGVAGAGKIGAQVGSFNWGALT